MTEAVITALISGICVAIPTIISIVVTSNTRDAVNEERIKHLSEKMDDLSTKVMRHNNLVERMALVERDMKTAFTRIDNLEKER